MLYRFQLTRDEIINIINLKYIPTSTTGYTLPVGIYEIFDINFQLKSLLPNEVKINTIFNDTRRKSNVTTNKTMKFTIKIFFLFNSRCYSISFR